MRWRSDQVRTTRLGNKGSNCAGVQRCQVSVRFNSPSAWAGFAPKLTATLAVTQTKNPALDLIPDLCHVLAGPVEHGCATKQHDIGARALVGAIVELHGVLQRFVLCLVQRKLSASTMLMFSPGSSHASSLSDLSGIELSTAS